MSRLVLIILRPSLVILNRKIAFVGRREESAPHNDGPPQSRGISPLFNQFVLHQRARDRVLDPTNGGVFHSKERKAAQASVTIVSRSDRSGCQPSTSRASALLAIAAAGSPRRRSA